MGEPEEQRQAWLPTRIGSGQRRPGWSHGAGRAQPGRTRGALSTGRALAGAVGWGLAVSSARRGGGSRARVTGDTRLQDCGVRSPGGQRPRPGGTSAGLPLCWILSETVAAVSPQGCRLWGVCGGSAPEPSCAHGPCGRPQELSDACLASAGGRGTVGRAGWGPGEAGRAPGPRASVSWRRLPVWRKRVGRRGRGRPPAVATPTRPSARHTGLC